MIDIKQCPICDSAESDLLHEMTLIEAEHRDAEQIRSRDSWYHRNWLLFERIVGRDEPEYRVEFRICEKCGLIFYSPRPTDSDLKIKYDDIAGNNNTEEREELRRLVDLRPRRAAAIRSLLERHWRINSGRALDIGGSDGHCLGTMTADFDCAILDFETRDIWPGVKRIGATMDDLGDDDLFDAIITCHTLEHIPDPLAFVTQVADHLSDGGIFYVEVPFGCAGEIHVTRDILTHLNFFSEGSLGYLMESAGLHVEYISTQPVLARNSYLDVVHLVARKDATREQKPKYLQRGYELTRGQMTQSIDRQVRNANIRLVLSMPLRYTAAMARRRSRLKATSQV